MDAPKPKRVRPANPMEKTCLAHLDEPNNWKILKAERPPESTRLGWKPFLPILRINMILFTVVLAVVFIGIELGAGSSSQDIREDAPFAALLVLLISLLLSAYVMNLYRTAWNRRAEKWRSED